MSAGNERKCSRCEKAINPTHYDRPSNLQHEGRAALLAGFCGVTCMKENARHVVADGRAWWQQGPSKFALLKALETATEEHLSVRGDALTRIRLQDALTAYEETGDHNHGRGPIAVGASCPGGDCHVDRARRALEGSK